MGSRMIARAMEQETELKFLIASEDLAKVKTLPSLRAALRQADDKRIETVYFDTPDQYLWWLDVFLQWMIPVSTPTADS
jgi:inorganic triphosphatase YgiF